MKIAIINGPNLNLLGKRETRIYGEENLDSVLSSIQKKHPGVQFVFLQSNVEGELINFIQDQGFTSNGIILNAGAFTHTSIALADAVAAVTSPVIEVHITNIFAREEFRHVSYLGAKCIGSISGFGVNVYEMAVNFFLAQKTD